jgi:hypothetical protein
MTTSHPGLIEVRLEGGPAYFPADQRQRQAAPDQEYIKVEHYGGYEHFERITPPGSLRSPVVFSWIRRTQIAE